MNVKRLAWLGMCNVIKAFMILKYKFWYNKATLNMAYLLYKETFLYKERCKLFGEDFATAIFAEKDYKYFLHKLTWKDKLIAFFLPYNVIG